MAQLGRIAAAGMLALSIVTVSYAGTITGSRTNTAALRVGTITGSRTGTISGSKAGTISGSRTGTITGSRIGTTPNGGIAAHTTDELFSAIIVLLVGLAW